MTKKTDLYTHLLPWVDDFAIWIAPGFKPTIKKKDDIPLLDSKEARVVRDRSAAAKKGWQTKREQAAKRSASAKKGHATRRKLKARFLKAKAALIQEGKRKVVSSSGRFQWQEKVDTIPGATEGDLELNWKVIGEYWERFKHLSKTMIRLHVVFSYNGRKFPGIISSKLHYDYNYAKAERDVLTWLADYRNERVAYERGAPIEIYAVTLDTRTEPRDTPKKRAKNDRLSRHNRSISRKKTKR